VRVTFQDMYEDLVRGSERARRYVDWWRHHFASIRDVVETFASEKLFSVSSADVSAVLKRGTHALGEIEKDRELLEVEDSHMPPTAMQDLFHWFIEREGSLPSWDEFRSFLLEPEQKPLIIGPWWSGLKESVQKYDRGRVRDAMHWRVARMYYSNLREVHFLARLRERHDISLKYHIFADVRLRADFWLGKHVVSVFLSNPRYRSQAGTRKHKAEEKLRDHIPSLTFNDVEFPNRYARGELYRVSDEEIDRLAASIGEREGK
jgi:hypothetical protein